MFYNEMMDRKEITRLINEWNSSRYELFALSQPNERMEFHGVMRFYFQDAGEKVSTKCIRVDSTATTQDVIEVLIEKFRPDMKSLSSPKDYAIYEVHADAQERKLDSNERPLWIQLEWGKEGREGRFLLKNENCKTIQLDANQESLIRDKKRMSKRDKKKLQKLQKESQKENSKVNVAEHLYKEVPDSNFTRSISNPEIVMARRRQQKLENKLKQIKNRDGGGTLKVYGETLKPDIPYKTLLMSNQDTAAFAVKETLEKYGLTQEDPENYCLVQVVTPSREERDKHGAQIKEYILEDNACPLAILMKHPSTGGSIIFQIRRCTPDILAIRKQKKKIELEKQNQIKFQTVQSQPNLQPQQQHQHQHQQQQQQIHQQQQQQTPLQLQQHLQTEQMNTKLPYLVEMSYEGFDLPQPRIVQIKSDFYEIGNDKYLASTHPLNYIRIEHTVPGIEKKHCAIKKSNDNLQLLLIPYAETYVNDRLVKEHTQLFNGFTIRLGKYCLFRLENPNEMQNIIIANNTNTNTIGNINSNNNNNNNTNSTQQVKQGQTLPANYGLLYESGQISETVSNRALSPVQIKQSQHTPQPTQSAKTAPNQSESGLPGLLEFPDDGEDSLLATICTSNQTNWQFKLAPVYTMYMMLRYRLSQKYKSESSFNEKLQSVSYLIHKMVNYIREAVDVNHLDKFILPYWLANSSELLYFLKQDVHLSQVSYDAQDALAECVQIAFKYLVNIMQQQLDLVLVSFFDPSDHIEDIGIELNEQTFDEFNSQSSRPTLKHVIQVLNEAMNLLRGSRVNAALTIQLFSQLFHYVSMWLFNRLVKDQRSGLCSRYWGDKLSRRLNKIQIWAEKQGLELAADCHLQRISQAAFFLLSPKHDIQDLSTISSNCFALNSLQIKCLIKNYLLAPNENPLSAQLCNNLIAIAQNTADEVIKQEGKQIQLEEDVDLQLPFLLPEDGHSSEFIKGLPTGLLEFLESLQNAGHCWLWQNTQGPGNWKKFMSKPETNSNEGNSQTQVNQPTTPKPIQIPDNTHPQIIKIKLAKKNNGLGLSIVAARGNNQITGIYIKSVVPGGAAHDDGRLGAGDQLLAVDDNSLINVTQEKAAELMCKSGPVVTLTIAKDAASYHDLDALLNKSPQPVQQQQQQIATSMPVLNNQNHFAQSNLMSQQQQNTFTAATLPRNHHLHQHINNNQITNEQVDSNQYRTRSMSQEILRNDEIGSNLQKMSQPQLPPQTNVINRNQFTSPTHQFQRQLPNEQTIRFGSERPSNFNQFQDNSSANRFINQRSLPNEIGPRYGSERPASTLPHFQQRFNPDSSPIKQQQQQQQPTPINLKQRQASLNELDEINYNNLIDSNKNNSNSNNNNNNNNNKFDDLYGKVNQNKSVPNQVQQMDQYKTLPSRAVQMNQNNQIFEDTRTKSFGQLYEQIWSNNNNNNNNNNNTNSINNSSTQSNPHLQRQQISVDDLNMNRLDLNPNQAKISRTNIQTFEQTNVRFNPVQQHITQPLISSQPQPALRNYENQMVSNNQTRPPPPPVLTKPALPAKNFNLNLQNNSRFNLNNHQDQHVELPVHLHQNGFSAGTAKIINQREVHVQQQQQQQQNTREKADEEFRLNLLKQRIEMLNELESKAYRTNEEENKLNKLRTEIEFDRRVIEMNTQMSMNGCLDETNEDNDMEYAPEVKERFAIEIIQRRKQFQPEETPKLGANQQEQQDFYTHKLEERFQLINKEKVKPNEFDRMLEQKREEQRLRKHIDRNSVTNLYNQQQAEDYNQNYNQNFQEIEVLHVPTRSSTDLSEIASRPQKHVQFRPDSELISPKPELTNDLKTTSSSSSSDQLDSSPSTPPPLPVQPQPNHHPKRVMFSDIEFERKDSKNDDLIQNTPSVIGANEVYVDQRLKMKLQLQQQQQQQNNTIEGEKLSFKDKMKLFAKQSGEQIINDSNENKLKVSKKQREIESKFVLDSKQ